jgi:hypothetical protein
MGSEIIMNACNGCDLARLKRKYGDKLIKVKGTWYLKNEQPLDGQVEPFHLDDGTPIQFVVWYMSEEHSGDCLLDLPISSGPLDAGDMGLNDWLNEDFTR